MQVNVRLFATLRQQAGWSERTFDLPDESDLARLLALIEEDEPALTLTDRPVYAAVNKQYAQTDTILSDGDEVALFPPVSGGSDE